MTSAENLLITNLIDKCVTSKDVKIVAQRIFSEPSAKVLDYSLSPFTEKIGFTGSHRLLKISVQKKNSKETETVQFMVKSMPYEIPQQADFLKKESIFYDESFFFSKIVPWISENYRSDKWAPTCHLASTDTLIFEDSKREGYKYVRSFADNLAYLKSALATIARFHSCSIMSESQLARLSKNHVTLGECYPNAFSEKVFTKSSGVYHWFISSVNTAVAIAERMGHKNGEKLRAAYLKMFDQVKKSKKHRNVICHADLWSNSIMFDDTKPVPKSILTEFHVIRYAPLALDLLQVLYINTTPEFRKKHEKELIEHYHAEMEKTIRNNDDAKDIEAPALREIVADYEELRSFGAAMATLYFQIMLMDQQVTVRKMMEGYENFIFGDRLELTLDQMKSNHVYKTRIEDAINEFVAIVDKH